MTQIEKLDPYDRFNVEIGQFQRYNPNTNLYQRVNETTNQYEDIHLESHKDIPVESRSVVKEVMSKVGDGLSSTGSWLKLNGSTAIAVVFAVFGPTFVKAAQENLRSRGVSKESIQTFGQIMRVIAPVLKIVLSGIAVISGLAAFGISTGGVGYFIVGALAFMAFYLKFMDEGMNVGNEDLLNTKILNRLANSIKEEVGIDKENDTLNHIFNAGELVLDVALVIFGGVDGILNAVTGAARGLLIAKTTLMTASAVKDYVEINHPEVKENVLEVVKDSPRMAREVGTEITERTAFAIYNNFSKVVGEKVLKRVQGETSGEAKEKEIKKAQKIKEEEEEKAQKIKEKEIKKAQKIKEEEEKKAQKRREDPKNWELLFGENPNDFPSMSTW